MAEGYKMTLPQAYITFLKSCLKRMPTNLVGTDLRDEKNDLNEQAVALLKENEIENFLSDDDFVFMMHQGYIFWYFKADGNPNPIVYGFQEGRKRPDNLGDFSNFIKNILKT